MLIVAIPEKIGRHSLWRSGDLVGIHYVGTITLPDLMQLRAVLDETHRVVGRCFLLSDMRRCDGIDGPARRFVADWNKQNTETTAAMAMYGLSFSLRAVTLMTIQAVRFLGLGQIEVGLHKDEAEARRWLDEQRARRFPEVRHGQ